MSILNKRISYYPSITETIKGIEVNLLDLLQCDKHKAIIERLRIERDPVTQKSIKETLPCFTVAGIFKRRNAKGLVSPSGLAAIDLDSVEDFDAISVMHELKKLPYIAYTGLSCRGQRLFCIIPFATEAYSKHYERLIKSFEDLGLPMGDSCHKQISQPRFVSYNDENTCFYNHNAKAYCLLPTVKTYNYPKASKKIFTDAPDNPFQWCVEQINKSHSFTEGQRHEYIKLLARYCNIKGLSQTDTLNGCLGYQSEDFNETEIKGIINYIYINQADSHNKIPFTSFEKSNNNTQKH
jgi:hypothetical protein